MPGPGIAWTTVERAIHDWVVWATGLANNQVIWATQNKGRPPPPLVTLRFGTVLRQGHDWVSYQRIPFTFNPLPITGFVSGKLTITAHGLALGDGPIQIVGTAAPAGLLLATDYWAVPVDANTLTFASTFLNARSGIILPVTDAGTAATVTSYASTLQAGREKTANTRGMRKVSLTMQAFAPVPAQSVGGSSATALLDAVVSGLRRRNPYLQAAGIGVMDLGPVRATDSTINASVFEPRAILEATLSLASEVQDTTTIIDRVLTYGAVTRENGTIIYENSDIPAGTPWAAGFGPGFGG